jgi:hypothetical protein
MTAELDVFPAPAAGLILEENSNSVIYVVGCPF